MPSNILDTFALKCEAEIFIRKICLTENFQAFVGMRQKFTRAIFFPQIQHRIFVTFERL